MIEIAWLKDIKTKAKEFIDILSENNYGYFKYSLSGDLYGSNNGWGLGQLVFAAKILFMLGLLDGITEEQKKNLTEGIKRFQDDKGYISDPLIIKLLSKKKLFLFKNRNNEFETEKIKRAETRQSFSALNCLGDKPEKPFLNVPYAEKEIETYLNSFDWNHPWDAGSHFSHLLFFLKLNKEMFDYESSQAERLIRYADRWIDAFQSERDGFWYKGETSTKEKINGAMKILTGREAARITEINHHKKIIDSCLSAVNDSEACSNFNIIYVLYCCSKVSGYRKDEIIKFCYERLKIYKDFYFENYGGFSFYRNRANDNYYGALITRGLNEPDIHGTVLFIWGIALISKIVDMDLFFNIPLT